MRGSEGRKSPSIVQGQLPVGVLGEAPAEADDICSKWCINTSSTEVLDTICSKKHFSTFPGASAPVAHACGRACGCPDPCFSFQRSWILKDASHATTLSLSKEDLQAVCLSVVLSVYWTGSLTGVNIDRLRKNSVPVLSFIHSSIKLTITGLPRAYVLCS